MTPSVPPAKVQLTDELVVIAWKDGHVSRYPHRFLRLRCLCAHCIDEWTRKPRLDTNSVPQEVKAVDYMTVGNYALQFLWSDTHYTGIYTYQFLRSVCQCETCGTEK